MMNQTGFPDNPPTRAAPWTGDYLTAYMCFGMAMAGLFYARSTGHGQVIDVAQFEAIHHTLGGTMIEYFHKQVIRERSGNKANAFQPYDTFEAQDGWVAIGAVSWPVFERLLKVVGLDPNDPKWRKAQTKVESIEGIEFDAIFRGWVAERTVAEVVKLMNDAEVACTAIMNSKDLAEDPHYKARDVNVEWDDDLVGPVTGIGIIPQFSLTPGKIWRGTVRVGHDNRRVYQGLLGLSDEELRRLEDENVI
jgi:succinyl-CoA---D-citramalate CoA-transferase